MRSELDLAIRLVVPSLEGWCSVEKALWMADALILHESKTIVEIGVFGGRSAIPLAMAAKELNATSQTARSRVFGYDPFEVSANIEGLSDLEHLQWWRAVDLEAVHKKLLAAIELIGVEKEITVLKERSISASLHHEIESIDFLHIDGNHSEVESLADVETWFPLVKRDGVIVLDDTDWPTVSAAYTRLQELCQEVHTVGTWSAFFKL